METPGIAVQLGQEGVWPMDVGNPYETRHAKLMDSFIKKYPIASDTIQSFNHWVKFRLGDMMENSIIPIRDPNNHDTGYFIRIELAKIYPPFKRINDGRNNYTLPITPMLCRLTGASYTAEIWVYLKIYHQSNPTVPVAYHFHPERPQVPMEIKSAQIPVILHSKLDILTHNGLDEVSLLKHGECPTDPGGYFLVNGPRTVLISDKLAMNKILITPFKTPSGVMSTECFFTSMGVTKSTKVILRRGPPGINNQIRLFVNIPRFKIDNRPTNINSINAVRYMTGRSIEQVLQMLREFYPADERRAQQVHNTLLPTIWVANSTSDQDLESAILDEIIRDPNDKPGSLRTLMNREMFPESNDVEQKGYTVCLMIVRYAENIAGLRKTDNRDAYQNKHFNNAPAQLEIDFRRQWGIEITNNLEKFAKDKLQKMLEDQRVGKTKQYDLSRIHQVVTSPAFIDALARKQTDFAIDIFKHLEDIFQSGAGRKSKFLGMTAIDPGETKTPQARASHITRVSTNVEAKAKIVGLRVVAPDQGGFIDVTETPEGDKSGLVKHKALTCRLSIPRLIDPLLNEISHLVRREGKGGIYTSILLVNGLFSGWVDGKAAFAILQQRKRTGFFATESIVLEGTTLSIYTTGSRPTRPLLIMNQQTRRLVIEEKDLWNASFDILLQNGCVEWLDPTEVDNSYIASSYDLIIRTRLEYAIASEQLEQIRPFFAAVNPYLVNQEKIYQLKSRPDASAILAEHPEYFQLDPSMLNLVNQDLIRLIKTEVFPSLVSTEDYRKYLKDANNGRLSDNQIAELADLFSRIYQGREKMEKQTRIKASFKHCEIDPQAILGVVSSTNPYPDHSQGPRVPYNTGMEKQGLGIIDSHIELRYETTTKFLPYSTQPITSTQTYRRYFSQTPGGFTPMVAICAFDGYNQEDALVIKKEAADRGLFEIMIYRTIRCNERSSEVTGLERKTEYISPYRPEAYMNTGAAWRKPIKENKPPEGSNVGIYSKLDPDYGIVRPGELVVPGDCLVFKIRQIISGSGNQITEYYEDASEYVSEGEQGFIDSILITNTGDKGVKGKTQAGRVIEIRIRERRGPEIGDKMYTRYAQKATVSRKVPTAELPFTKNPDGSRGISPDIIINAMTIPSRMTIGLMIEGIMSKAAILAGTLSPSLTDATAFRRRFPTDDPLNLKEYRRYLQEAMKILEVNGYNPDGSENMYIVSQHDGKERQIKTPIFMAPLYYKYLPHMATKKSQVRSGGKIKMSTRQALGGKKRGSGLRLGEMERDAMISHAVSNVLREEFCLASDVFRAVFCRVCGIPAIVDYQNAQVICNNCDLRNPEDLHPVPRVAPMIPSDNSGNKKRFTFVDIEQARKDFCVSVVPFVFIMTRNLVSGAMMDLHLDFPQKS